MPDSAARNVRRRNRIRNLFQIDRHHQMKVKAGLAHTGGILGTAMTQFPECAIARMPVHSGATRAQSS